MYVLDVFKYYIYFKHNKASLLIHILTLYERVEKFNNMVNCMKGNVGWKIESSHATHSILVFYEIVTKNLIFSRVLKVFKQNGLYGNNFAR